ncbi:MAG: PIF1 family DEAD/DEAH box helicase [Bacteroidota bacterium]
MLDDAPIQLNADFQYALDALEKGANMFITGKAGTGKSTLLQLFRDTTRKKVVVLAPTGIAALNVKGQTIHSFFGFPPKPITKADIKQKRYRGLYQKLDVMIIDEISMVRADMLDNIDHFLRINRDMLDEPFGGVQVVFFGDLFQLPPVVKKEEAEYFRTNYQSPYFFSADVMQEIELERLELSFVYRQDNRAFIRLLDNIRTNSLDYDDLEALNERYYKELSDYEMEGHFITLSARNNEVDRINHQQLSKLQGTEVTFTGRADGNFTERLFPTDIILKLRVGAQVMFVKNDPKRRFVNGTIGTVTQLTQDQIKVTITDEEGNPRGINVKKMDWELIRHKIDDDGNIGSDTIGTFVQYPLRLAWAITIHKSQGKTFDKVIIDLGKGSFAHGQTYVALSRCTSLQGVVLKQRIRPRDIMLDPRIVEYNESQY